MCSRSTWRSRWQPRRAPATAPYGTTRTGSERTIRRPTKPSNTQTAPSKGEASFAAISTPCCLLARLGLASLHQRRRLAPPRKLSVSSLTVCALFAGPTQLHRADAAAGRGVHRGGSRRHRQGSQARGDRRRRRGESAEAAQGYVGASTILGTVFAALFRCCIVLCPCSCRSPS